MDSIQGGYGGVDVVVSVWMGSVQHGYGLSKMCNFGVDELNPH